MTEFPCELQHEVTQRADRDLPCDRARSSSGASGCRESTSSSAFAISRSIRSSALTPRPFAARDLDIGSPAVLLGELDAEFSAGRRSQRDHLIGEVHGCIRLLLEAECPQAGDDDILQVRLARIDDVVHARAAAESGRAVLVQADRRDP